jgi:hypothetical protein
MIRKYTYLDYYGEELRKDNPSPRVLRAHIGKLDILPQYRETVAKRALDHCIDQLRQVLICNADVGLIPSFWVEGRELAKPDFAAQKKCRDFDSIIHWGRQRRIKFDRTLVPAPEEKIWPVGGHP